MNFNEPEIPHPMPPEQPPEPSQPPPSPVPPLPNPAAPAPQGGGRLRFEIDFFLLAFGHNLPGSNLSETQVPFF
jgi:hypothetical protein